MAKTGTPFEKAASAYRRPCLRTDLKLVYENPETGKGQVRIVDPKSGRQYTFNEKEHALCRQADGTRDLEQIHDRVAGSEAAATPAELVEFFRRLHILGLLEPEGTEAPHAATSSAAGRAAGLRNRRQVQQGQGAGIGPGRGMGAGIGPAMGRGAGAGGRPAAGRGGDATEMTEVANRVRARASSRTRGSEGTGTGPDTPAEGQTPPAPVQAPVQARPDAPDTLGRTGRETRSDTGSDAGVAPETTAAQDAAAGSPDRPADTAPASSTGPGGRLGRGMGRMGPGQSGPGRRPGQPEGGGTPRRGEAQASLTAAAARVRERARKPAADAPETGPQNAADTATDAKTVTASPSATPPSDSGAASAQGPASAAPGHAETDDIPARPPARRGLGAVLQLPERRRKGSDKAPSAASDSALPPSASRPEPGRVASVTSLPATSTVAGTTARTTARAADPDADPDGDPDRAPERTDDPADGGTAPPAGEASGKTGAAPEPDVPAFNFFDPSFDDADGGMPGPGGMGGGMGGGMMRGGGGGGMMGGGGAMGGMMGGAMGGMGGMMGGGGGGMMRGGMGGGMMGGGMGGAPGGASAGPKMPGQWKWFNPQGILRLLYVLFYPLKYVLWAIVPLVTIAGLSMLNNIDELIEDLGIILTDISSITQFAVGLFIVNLASRIAQGVAIVAHGGKVPAFGIALVLGVLPRFYVDKRQIAELDRKGQLWGHGSPLLARLMTFAIGILIWSTSRETGTFLPQVALISAQFGLIMFVATSWPLMLSDGMRWLSTYLNEPKLVPKALMAFKHVFLRSPLPPMMSKKDVPALIFFAIGSILSMTLILSVMGLGALIFLETTLDGLGVLIFMGIVVAFTIWVLALWASVTAQGKAKGNFNKDAFRQFTQGDKPTADAMPDLDGMDEEALPSKAKVVWGVILVILVVLAFQPYQYDAGGQVVILPVSKAQAIARAEGEIIEVMVAEGDQVSRGQILAQLSSWDQERQVAVTRTDLNAAEANLARLIEGASPEEIEVARRQVTSAEASLAFSRAEYERARNLAATGTGSQAAMEKAQSTLETDIAGLDVAQASLDLILAEASANDIAIAQSEVDRLTLELQFQRDELERTRVTAPMDGRVVTANLQLLIGKYLRSGDPLLEIENAQVVTAEIAVPESDIALIDSGDPVRLRVTGHADTEIVGEVQAIAPAAEDEGYGSVVRVAAIFENGTDFLRSGMTGYAKIDGAEMRAWEAYLRSIRRFFQIEVWSWIP